MAAVYMSLGDGYTEKAPAFRPTEAVSTIADATSSTQTDPLGGGVLRVFASAAVYYSIGSNPTASSNSHFLPATTPYDIVVKNGERVAFLNA
ncbi:MAG: hypothetical protein AAF607_10195 [Pseudomonadota bacterium]